MTNQKTMLVDSITKKTTQDGLVFYRIRFSDLKTNIVAFDAIPACSIRLNYLCKAAGISEDSDIASELIGKVVNCTIVEKIGINRKDNQPFTSLVVDKYQTKGE